MCFNLQKEYSEELTADRDIVCYKELDLYCGCIISPILKFRYELGKTYLNYLEFFLRKKI